MRTSDWSLWILRIAFAIVMLFVLALFEYVASYYVPLWVYALIIAVSYATLWGLSIHCSKVEKLVLPTLFSLGLCVLFLDAGDSSQSLIRQLQRVQPGMNISQVEAIMAPYARSNRLFKIQNTRRTPSGELVLTRPNCAIYKHSTPEDGSYDSAAGIVNFKAGRVTSVEYYGD